MQVNKLQVRSQRQVKLVGFTSSIARLLDLRLRLSNMRFCRVISQD